MLLGGFDEIVHISVWYGMMMSMELGEVRGFNPIMSQILSACYVTGVMLRTGEKK